MKINSCAYCDSKSNELIPITYAGVDFDLCIDCLVNLLEQINSEKLLSLVGVC